MIYLESEKMDDIKNLKELLEKGLYFNNLKELEEFCNSKVLAQERNLVSWYILEDIFHQLRELWRAHEPVAATEETRINSVLLEPINELIDLITEGSVNDNNIKLEVIIKKYLELSRTLR